MGNNRERFAKGGPDAEEVGGMQMRTVFFRYCYSSWLRMGWGGDLLLFTPHIRNTSQWT